MRGGSLERGLDAIVEVAVVVMQEIGGWQTLVASPNPGVGGSEIISRYNLQFLSEHAGLWSFMDSNNFGMNYTTIQNTTRQRPSSDK